MPITIPITGKEIAEKVIPLIKGAKKQIEVIVYEWRWYPGEPGTNIQQFNNEIVNAVKRSVIVKVIAQPEKTRKILKENGIKTREFHMTKKIHTKMMIIDNRVAIVGSHNYTKNAFNINEELSLITDDSNTIERLKEYFDNIWSL
jgi:phosphatidylserine/phosphatidylglycerophosphate/cardiolipin synthase-like enzyme